MRYRHAELHAHLCAAHGHRWMPAVRALFQSQPNPAAPWFLGIWPVLVTTGEEACARCGERRPDPRGSAVYG